MLNPSYLCGWIDGPERHVMAATMPRFGAVARQLLSSPQTDSKPVLLYKAWSDVLKQYPDYKAQEIGDCVSFGHAHANDLAQCVEIVAGEPLGFAYTDTEALYGMAREVGGMLGRGDGCYGSAAVKAMTTMGIVSREMLGSEGEYSGKRAKAWGYSGVPKEVKTKAANYKLGSAALVQTWDELVAAISNGYPVTICTASGFTMTRDNQGFCRMSGRWGHCMMIGGVRFDRPGALIVQSWGPGVPSGPVDLDQPDYSFWADRRAIESILSEGDSWALSKAPAFVKRDLPEHWSYQVAA